jgi:anti-sigma B factor antagonist
MTGGHAMTCGLNIREELSDEYVKVELEGEIDILTSQSLKETLYAIAEKYQKDIKIDCKKLNYIDSTGLGVLVGTLKKIRQYNKNVYICFLKDNIRKLFVITGLDKVFVIEG